MFLDARSVEEGRLFESDVCIVGAGAAGITLALRLAEADFRVTLVESGGFELEPGTQQLYGGKSLGLAYPLESSRLRYFGGSTNHWGGACRPIEPFDFEPHAWVPDSGWPITSKDLEPYYDQAREILDLPRPHYRFDPRERGAQDHPPLLGSDPSGFETVMWRRPQPGPTRMGRKFRSRIQRSERILCVLHANATELEPHESARRITQLRAATLDGRGLRFAGRRFVLCAGAVENARLLLLSDGRIQGGIGNQNDLVGRFFSDHLSQVLGSILVTPSATGELFREEAFLRAPGAQGPTKDLLGFASTPALREQHGLLGFSVLAHAEDRRLAGEPATQAVWELAHAVRGSRSEPVRVIKLVLVAEQSPNPNSRILLEHERDELGLRRTAVDRNLREEDLRSVLDSSRYFALALSRRGSGRLHLDDVTVEVATSGGAHPSGTARMSDDPKKGVTDRNARVHGVQNLFVAGGALFPTAGYANPTLTIVALTLRLADFLKTTSSATD